MSRILVTRTAGPDHAAPLIGALESQGHAVVVASDSTPVFREAAQSPYDVAFIELELVRAEAMDLIGFLKGLNPDMEIVTTTPVEDVREAALTVQRGASFYLVEPIDGETACRIVRNAGNKQQNALVVRQVQHRTLEGLFGESPAMTRLFRTVLKVAPTDATILVTGESGTGKELLAQVIHRLSKRNAGRFVAVNCAAIPEPLLESELFGHVRGAFTGAIHDKKGLIEEADGGTCFLDEIGELPVSIQVKLLRFLQDRQVRSVGSVISRTIDVRVLAATNRTLAEEIRRGNFREDLFYRINVINLHLLPLRERKETLGTLISHILGRLTRRHDKIVTGVSPEALRILTLYDFPGNIRELENILEYGVIMTEDGLIERKDLPPHLGDPGVPLIEGATGEAAWRPDQGSRMLTLDEMENLYVEEVLRRCGGNQSEAARALGISRTSLWRKLKKSGAGGGPDEELPTPEEREVGS